MHRPWHSQGRGKLRAASLNLKRLDMSATAAAAAATAAPAAAPARALEGSVPVDAFSTS